MDRAIQKLPSTAETNEHQIVPSVASHKQIVETKSNKIWILDFLVIDASPAGQRAESAVGTACWSH